MKKSAPLIMILLVFLALACGNSSGGSSSKEESAKEQPPASYGLNQDVTVGSVRWKVLEVTDLGNELKSDNQFIEAKSTSGKFVSVRFEVENQGSEAKSYAGVDLKDSKDRTFTRYSEAFGFIEQNETCVLEQLNPNIAKVCVEIFELPADATGLKANVGDLELLGSDEALIDLGM